MVATWRRGGAGRDGEVWLSLGPSSQRQGRRVWLPTCPGPRPQALQPPGSPGPPSWPTAPGWDAGPHFPEESERGLGQTQSLEVGQMLLGRSWGPGAGPGTGRPWAAAHPAGHGGVSTWMGTHYPMLGAMNAGPMQGPCPCPAAQTGPPTPQLWLEVARGIHEGPERGTWAPPQAPGALGASLTLRRTSQQGRAATNRMWPASRRHSPALGRWEERPRGGRSS